MKLAGFGGPCLQPQQSRGGSRGISVTLRRASAAYLISGYSDLHSETLFQISKQAQPFLKKKKGGDFINKASICAGLWRWVGFWPSELGRIAEVLSTGLKSWLRGPMSGVGCPGPRAKDRIDPWRLSSDFHVYSKACTLHTHKNLKIIENGHLNKWY